MRRSFEIILLNIFNFFIKFKILTNFIFFLFLSEVLVEYFQTGRGNQGLRINDYTYKRHYETGTSIYWICTLASKLKCKQRVIAEKDKPYSIRFKGKGHNHDLADYLRLSRSRSNLANALVRKENIVKTSDFRDEKSEITFP